MRHLVRFTPLLNTKWRSRLSISFAMLALAGQGYSADSLTVTFRYTDVSGTAIRAFVPGEFNNWGPNSNSMIAPGAISQMEYDSGIQCWTKKIKLEIGKNYSYKFHLHFDANGSLYQWLPDPFNPLTDGSQFVNSLLPVSGIMIFEPEARKNPDSSTSKIMAGVFSSATITQLRLAIGGDTIDVTDSHNPETGILVYVPSSGISSGTSISIIARDQLGRTASYRFQGSAKGNRKIDVTFLFHANQNLVPYGRVGDRACFRGLLQTLRKHPTLKIQLHFSGTLIHDLLWFGDSTLSLIREGIQDGQFEIFGSTYVQNVMFSTRTDSSDVSFNDQQIKIHRDLIKKTLGVTPAAFWNPERVWTQSFVQLLADNGYQYVQVEDHILEASGITGPVTRVFTTSHNGRHLTVFEDDKVFLNLVDGAINTGNVASVINYLHGKRTEDVQDEFVIGYYQDAEATGLWDYENRQDPTLNFAHLDALLSGLENDTLINVTTYQDYLRSHSPSGEVTPIVDGAAAWMGGDAWFSENLAPEFESMRGVYRSLREFLDSVALEIQSAEGNKEAANALLKHAWFSLCAHQFEFGCRGLESGINQAQFQLARTAAVSATAALFALHPTSIVYAADVNWDGVNELVLVNPYDFYVFSVTGGRLLYWFDLERGEELVGNENFMADYVEPYVNDNNALPLIRGGIETYWWLAGNYVIPEILQWTFVVRKRALNDILTVGASPSDTLNNTSYTVMQTDSTLTFSTTARGIVLKKLVSADRTGLNVKYRMVSSLAGSASVGLEIQNSFSPSYLEVMDNGRTSLAYRDNSGATSSSVSSSTVGVENTVTGAHVSYGWSVHPDGLNGIEDVFGLELNPYYHKTVSPGDSAEISFTLERRQTGTSVQAGTDLEPRVAQLFQNYPNPFNPKTVVSSQLPVASDVRLAVYDLLGREVTVLANEKRRAGTYHDVFDGTGLASGMYFYRLTAGDFIQTRKMVIVK